MAHRVIALALSAAIGASFVPHARAQCAAVDPVLTVSIDSDGSLYVDGKPVDEGGLMRAAREYASQEALARAFVIPHPFARQKYVNRAVATLAQSRIERIFLVPPEVHEN